MITEKAWHRRYAIQLIAQLPEEKEDALGVLQAAVRIVELPGFWTSEATAKPTLTVVTIGGDDRA